MRLAFKEWSVIVDALGRGDQILIFRKGGLREGTGGFRPDHAEFLLYPTRYHARREDLVSPTRERWDEILGAQPGDHRVRIEFLARLQAARHLVSVEALQALKGQHVWSEEVLARRFEWGATRGVHALAVRVFRLAAPMELAWDPAAGGCRSWVELGASLPTDGMAPVLTDAQFSERLAAFEGASAAPPR